MNFLAHTFLSCQDEQLLVGNFLGDFVRNRDLGNFSLRVQEGVHLHRKIDRYTDQHPLVRKAMSRLYERHSKYASVLIDVFYDYCLSVNWPLYSPEESLEAFSERIYQILNNHLHEMPDRVQERLPRMIEDNWLCGYRTLRGVQKTVRFLQRRTSRPELLEGAIESLQRDEATLNLEFNSFFPEVIAFVQQECFCD